MDLLIFLKRKKLAIPVLMAALAFSAAVCQHTLISETGRLLIFDSCHYMESARRMCDFLLSLFRTHHGPLDPKLYEFLNLDGLSMPLIGSVSYILNEFHLCPVKTGLLLTQSVLHAVNSVLVFSVSRHLGRSTRFSTLAASVWALYPPALISCGTFLSEIVSCTMILLVTELSVLQYNHPSKARYFGCAVLTALIALSKPALLPVSFILALFLLLEKKLQKTHVASISAGFLAVLIPWILFTWLLSGQFSLGPNRLASANMALGCDYDVDGWETMPVPPRTMANYYRAPLATLVSSWRSAPVEMMRLNLIKTFRMLFGIFNDFHDTVLGLPFQFQLHWHQFLGSALLAGIIIFTRKDFVPANRPELIPFLVVLAHFAYLPFEAIPRYFFSAVPAAVLVITGLLSKSSTDLRLFGTYSITTIGLFTIVLNLDRPPYFQISLDAGAIASKNFTFSTASPIKADWLALLIDSNNLKSSDLEIRVNEANISSRTEPLRDYPSGNIHQKKINEIQELFMSKRNSSCENLHQWYICILEQRLIRNNMKVELIATKPLAVYARKTDSEKDLLCIPSLRYFSITKLAQSSDGLEGRIFDRKFTRVAKTSSEIQVSGKRKITLPANEDLNIFLLYAERKPEYLDAESGHSNSKIFLL